MNVFTVLIIIAIVLIASTIHGIVGFGFALLLVSALSISDSPLADFVPIIVALSLLIDIVILINSRKYIDFKRIWLLALFGIIGVPVGFFVLTNVNSDVLKIIIGIILMCTENIWVPKLVNYILIHFPN